MTFACALARRQVLTVELQAGQKLRAEAGNLICKSNNNNKSGVCCK
jgi:uncharacterized protein (AIM24 family)